MDREIIVKAGFVAIDKTSGGELTVTEYCAVEMNGSLYMTEGWREKRDANEAAWEGDLPALAIGHQPQARQLRYLGIPRRR